MTELKDLTVTQHFTDGRPAAPTSVAIVGFAPETLQYLKDSKAEEIWTMNHHLFLEEKKTGTERMLPRVDRLFELHRPEWFTRKEQPQAIAYREWLHEEHNFPIYMLEKMDEFPGAVRFPREEIRQDLFSKLWRGDRNEVEYYTSSVGLMIALAIHMGVKRIELYGIEMASDTEYADQKPAGEFMLGYALGRGTDVWVHPRCALLNAKVYGYEGVPHITRARLEELQIHYKRLEKKHDEKLKRAVEAVAAGKEKDPKVALKAEGWAMMYRGVCNMIDTLFHEHEEYTSAQFLEEKVNNYMYLRGEFQGKANMTKARFELMYNEQRPEVGDLWAKYREERSTMFALDGAVQFLKKLREECRLQKPNHDLVMNITE